MGCFSTYALCEVESPKNISTEANGLEVVGPYFYNNNDSYS